MKKLLVCLLCLTLCVGAAFAEGTTITVNGKASSMAMPDRVTLSFTASSVNEDLVESRRQVAEAVSNVSDAIVELGLEREALTTDGYYIFPTYNYEVSPAEVTAYETNHNLKLSCINIELLDELLSKITAAGITGINNISFDVASSDALYRDALKHAMVDAREKAECIADTEGMVVAGIVSINESDAYSNYTARSFAMNEAGGNGDIETGIHSGSVSVDASVTVTYALK